MKTLYIAIISLLLCACSSAPELSDVPGGGVGELPESTPVQLVAAAEFPEIRFGAESSRAMTDEPTVDELLHTLKVNLFVFDRSGVMLQFIGPEDVSVLSIDEQEKRVYFKVSGIYSSSQPRRLHFVITSAPDLHAITGGEYISAMAGETTTMPALTVQDGIDAYWGIREMAEITENTELNLKLIRNFVKLDVSCSDVSGPFRLLGFTVVNRPSRGTVAPYIYRDHLFASFLNPDTDRLISYADIIAQGYFGVNPAGSDATMTHTTESEVGAALAESEARIAAGNPSPCYIYERSQSSLTSAGSDVMVTYIIVSGIYNGKKCYYKIDIGRDDKGKFGYYDLLRNFQYTVEITEVGGEGAPTLLDAMNGAAHNNLSTSVVTRDLFSIGYLGDKIEVGATRVFFTEQTTEYALRFRYTPADGTALDPSQLLVYDVANEAVEYNVAGVGINSRKSVDLAGDVIRDAYITQMADKWYELRVTTHEIPSDSRRLEQNLRFYYTGGSGGLGRTVTLMLRRPWEFAGVSKTNPGAALQADFSVSFSLPAGLSFAQFPLVITFESDKQNIYAVNGSDITVATGKSGFSGATTDRVIYYEWRVEWEEYKPDIPYTAHFRMNTTAATDRAYPTAAIDAAGIAMRNPNNNTQNFALRMANKGQKYFQPICLNLTR